MKRERDRDSIDNTRPANLVNGLGLADKSYASARPLLLTFGRGICMFGGEGLFFSLRGCYNQGMIRVGDDNL